MFQNTERSFAYARQLNDQCSTHITQDHLIFLSALALRQNAAHIAEQLLSTLWPTAHKAIPSLRIMAMLEMRKFVEVLRIMQSISTVMVYDEKKTAKKEIICSEVVRSKNCGA